MSGVDIQQWGPIFTRSLAVVVFYGITVAVIVLATKIKGEVLLKAFLIVNICVSNVLFCQPIIADIINLYRPIQ